MIKPTTNKLKSAAVSCILTLTVLLGACGSTDKPMTLEAARNILLTGTNYRLCLSVKTEQSGDGYYEEEFTDILRDGDKQRSYKSNIAGPVFDEEYLHRTEDATYRYRYFTDGPLYREKIGDEQAFDDDRLPLFGILTPVLIDQLFNADNYSKSGGKYTYNAEDKTLSGTGTQFDSAKISPGKDTLILTVTLTDADKTTTVTLGITDVGITEVVIPDYSLF